MQEPIPGLFHVRRLRDQADRSRLRNKAKLKPIELIDPRNSQLRAILQRAEFAMTAGDDVIQGDDEEGPTGSASESE